MRLRSACLGAMMSVGLVAAACAEGVQRSDPCPVETAVPADCRPSGVAMPADAGEEVTARYRRARTLLDQKRFAEALEATGWLLAEDRAGVATASGEIVGGRPVGLRSAARLRHAEALISLGRNREADIVLRSITGDVPVAVDLLARAQARYALSPQHDRLALAIADARAAVRYDHSYAFAWWWLGARLAEQRRFGEALEAIETAMSFGDPVLSPEMPEMLWTRARLLRSLERTGEAESAGISALTAAVAIGGSSMGRIVESLRARGHWREADVPQRIDPRVTAAVVACLNDAGCR